MKKIISLILSMLAIITMISLAGCKNKETLKFGMGIHSSISKATDADGDTNGKGEVSETAAAVLLDKDGKIVKCVIDTADNAASYTSEGKFVEASEFKTKYELRDDYGMKKFGGAKKEWYEQVDAFTTIVLGKTVDQVKALAANGGKGNDDVIKAGCTITVSEFILAIEKAAKNAVESNATADDDVKLGIVSSQSNGKDAVEDAEGSNQIDTTFVATVLDKNKKIVAASTDCIQAKFTFDAKGKSTTDTSAALSTKKEAGKNYGMSKYGTDFNKDGVIKEWYEQAAAFDAALVDKTASDISGIAAEDGHGNSDLQKAGCTIIVSDMVKAAVKAATVA